MTAFHDFVITLDTHQSSIYKIKESRYTDYDPRGQDEVSRRIFVAYPMRSPVPTGEGIHRESARTNEHTTMVYTAWIRDAEFIRRELGDYGLRVRAAA